MEASFYINHAASQMKARGDNTPTPGWCANVTALVNELGDRFGGPDVLAHWIMERARSNYQGITKAQRHRIARASGGDQATFHRLIAFECGDLRTKRWRHNWTAMDITTYLETLRQERRHEQPV